MLEEKLQDLSTKQRLDGDDAFTLLQLLQDHTAPILSLRSVGSSPASRQPTSRLAKTNGLALERRSTCVERSGDGLKGGNRRVVGQRGGKGMNTPELGRVGGEQGGRNSSLGVSSKRTLFGPSLESHSEPRLGSAAAVCARSSSLNFNSLEEFPPMQPAATITTRYSSNIAIQTLFPVGTCIHVYWHPCSFICEYDNGTYLFLLNHQEER